MLRRLGSPRLAAVLIGILLALCMLSFVVPQKSHSALTLYDDWAARSPGLAKVAASVGFDDVFGSATFFATMGLLAMNLSACTWSRVQRRRKRELRVPSEPPASAHRLVLDSGADGVGATIGAALHVRRPQVAQAGNATLWLFDCGRWGFIGSLILHIGLLLLIVGGVVSGMTRFDGRMVLTEGETLPDAAESYMGPPREPVIGDVYQPFGVRLDSLRFDYEDGYILQSYAQVSFLEGDRAETRNARVNAPARWRGKSFLLIKGGHAVRLSVMDETGRMLLDDTVIRLGGSARGGYTDDVELADGRVLNLTTRANYQDEAQSRLEPLHLTDPGVTVVFKDGSDGAVIRPGAAAAIGDLRVQVTDVRLWNEFAVRADGGIPITYAAFGIILLGTLLRLAFGRRTVRCLTTESESGCEVAVWASDDVALARAVDAVGVLAEPDESRAR